MSPAAPRVSVCIPAYNGAEFIGEAVRSVLGQTFEDFELVIVDDGSTDGTAEAARGFADPRIRIIVNPQNLGQRENWNNALAEARGEFFKLLPQDDFLYPDGLRRQVDIFDDPENAGVALASGARNIVDRRGRVLMKRAYGRKRGRVDGRRAVRDCVRAGTNLIGEPGAVLMRTELAREIGQFDDANFYVLDLDFWSRALLEGDLYVAAEVLAAFRVAAGSASLRIARSQSRDFRNFIDGLSRDGRFGIRARDKAIGKARSAANMALRRMIYRWGRARVAPGG
jgi:glycosyltransferase involved in cell wall biosynthesis